MILFMSEGRFGNQLFQYAFLKTIQKNNETIIVTGFDDLLSVFQLQDISIIEKNRRWSRMFLFRIVKPLINFLSRLRLITTIFVDHDIPLENYSRESSTYTKITGLFPFFTFVKLGFFQSEHFFDPVVLQDLHIKNIHLKEAQTFLQTVPNSAHLVFVHIRQGDYKTFTVYGESTLLPIQYFKKQIMWFLQHRKNPFFIFLSDEPKFIEEHFTDIENKIISTQNHFGTDFAIMQQCQSAILSPSSFGWWGAYFMTKRDTVFTPKYWLGFNRKIDYQAEPNLHFAKEVEICL